MSCTDTFVTLWPNILPTTRFSSLEQDGYFEKDRVPKGDPGKREFTYLMLGAGRFAYASAARLILLKVCQMSRVRSVVGACLALV